MISSRENLTSYESLRGRNDAPLSLPLPGEAWDEVPVEPTLDELYAGASYEELSKLASEAFFENHNAYQNAAKRLRKSKMPLAWLGEAERADPNEQVERVLPFVTWRIREKHRLQSPLVSLVDRIQNANLYVVTAARKYDPEQGASFMSMFSPLLKKHIMRPERGGAYLKSSHPIIQTDLIRIPHGNHGYYHLKDLHAGKNVEFDRELEVEEMDQFGDFTDEERQQYKDHVTEHIPFHYLEELEHETGEAFSEDFIDQDPSNDPYEAAVAKVPHTGITEVLHTVNEDEGDALIARTGINSREALTFTEAAATLQIPLDTMRRRYYAVTGRLRKMPGIRELINGTGSIEPANPDGETAGVALQSDSIELAEETPLVESVRFLLNGWDGVLAGMRDRGVSAYMIARRAQLHPFYAEHKIKGRVFMTDEEAENILEAAGHLAQQRLHSSLYELAPSRSMILDAIFLIMTEKSEQETGLIDAGTTT